MVEFGVHPISTTTARQVLKEKLQAMQITDREPTIVNTIRISDELSKAHGLYISTNCLLSIWTDLFKE